MDRRLDKPKAICPFILKVQDIINGILKLSEMCLAYIEDIQFFGMNMLFILSSEVKNEWLGDKNLKILFITYNFET